MPIVFGIAIDQLRIFFQYESRYIQIEKLLDDTSINDENAVELKME